MRGRYSGMQFYRDNVSFLLTSAIIIKYKLWNALVDSECRKNTLENAYTQDDIINPGNAATADGDLWGRSGGYNYK